MFVLDAEDGPYPSSCNLAERDHEGQESRVLDIVAVDGVEDPIEAEDRVKDHGCVVDPYRLEGEIVAEKAWVRVEVKEGPIHNEVPDT